MTDVSGGTDFVVTLRPTTRCSMPAVALRRLLKAALRVYGLRCVGIHPTRHEKLGE